MVAARHGQIGISTGAFCKTEAVQTYKSLLKQRRRWFLGFITNEVCMLTDKRLWVRYPFLCLIRLAQNTIRTTALLFFIMVISLLTTSQRVDELPVGFIAVSLGLNWALMAYFAASLGRYKILLYPLLFVVSISAYLPRLLVNEPRSDRSSTGSTWYMASLRRVNVLGVDHGQMRAKQMM